MILGGDPRSQSVRRCYLHLRWYYLMKSTLHENTRAKLKGALLWVVCISSVIIGIPDETVFELCSLCLIHRSLKLEYIAFRSFHIPSAHFVQMQSYQHSILQFSQEIIQETTRW